MSHLIQEVGFGWSMRISSFIILILLVTANVTVRAFNKPRPHLLSLRQAIRPFRETPFLLLFTGLVLFTFGFYVPINYISVEAAASGMSQSVVQYLVAILNGARFALISLPTCMISNQSIAYLGAWAQGWQAILLDITTSSSSSVILRGFLS